MFPIIAALLAIVAAIGSWVYIAAVLVRDYLGTARRHAEYLAEDDDR